MKERQEIAARKRLSAQKTMQKLSVISFCPRCFYVVDTGGGGKIKISNRSSLETNIGAIFFDHFLSEKYTYAHKLEFDYFFDLLGFERIIKILLIHSTFI